MVIFPHNPTVIITILLTLLVLSYVLLIFIKWNSNMILFTIFLLLDFCICILYLIATILVYEERKNKINLKLRYNLGVIFSIIFEVILLI